MEAEQTIAEIEWLERIFAVPDTRPLNPNDLSAANRRHDEANAYSPWFRIWERYGVCCRLESSALRLGRYKWLDIRRIKYLHRNSHLRLRWVSNESDGTGGASKSSV